MILDPEKKHDRRAQALAARPVEAKAEPTREALLAQIEVNMETIRTQSAQLADLEGKAVINLSQQDYDNLVRDAMSWRAVEAKAEAGEPRADVSDALWCMECGYRRGTSSGQTRTKCPHGHGDLVRARLLTLEVFSKIVPRPAPAAPEGLREALVRARRRLEAVLTFIAEANAALRGKVGKP